MNRKILVGVFAVFAVTALGMFGVVSAQSNSQQISVEATYSQRLEEATTDTEKARGVLEEEGARSCQLTANHLKGLHQRAGLTLDYRVATYQTILSETNQLAINVESNDEPASGLRAAIAELSDRVTDFTTSYSQYRAELLEAANIACNEQTELRATVGRTLSALRTSQFHAERIADFAQSELTQSLELNDE